MCRLLPFSCSRQRLRSQAGFTLSELMVAPVIGLIILTAVISTYLFAIKGFRAVSNYSEIHQDARSAVNAFAKDMRAVSALTAFSTNLVTVQIPTAFSSTGTILSNKTVSYTFSQGTLSRFDSSVGTTTPLARNIHQLSYTLYDRVGSNTTIIATAKSIAVEIRLRKYVMSTLQSEDFIAARLDMRNKP